MHCITKYYDNMAMASFRMDNRLLRKIENLAKKRNSDRSTIIKQTIELGINEMKIGDAISKYQQGNASAWKCANEAGISLWQFLEVLKKRKIFFRTGEEETEKMIEGSK